MHREAQFLKKRPWLMHIYMGFGQGETSIKRLMHCGANLQERRVNWVLDLDVHSFSICCRPRPSAYFLLPLSLDS